MMRASARSHGWRTRPSAISSTPKRSSVSVMKSRRAKCFIGRPPQARRSRLLARLELVEQLPHRRLDFLADLRELLVGAADGLGQRRAEEALGVGGRIPAHVLR